MVERTDPGSVGVVAGRIVGLLTALVTVVGLLAYQDTFYQAVRVVFAGLESDIGVPLWVLFWGDIALVAAGRYVLSHVVGSLIGVFYDWIDRPGLPILVAVVVLIGVTDGLYAALSAQSLLVGVGFVLAWLCYVPVFVWFLEDDAPRRGPVRLE